VPRHDHAVELLRQVAADYGAARRRAASLRETVLRDFAPARVAETLFEVAPELANAAGDSTPVQERKTVRSQPSRRARARSDELLLVGLNVGGWRPAFDNWIEMAQHHGYEWELIGGDVAEPFIAFATKWRLMLDFLSDQPRDRLVFFLDSTDAFVCDDVDSALARYRSYGTPVVLGAEHSGRPASEDPEKRRSSGNSGAIVGEAGVVVDALRVGFEIPDWHEFEEVNDQHALLLYFQHEQHQGKLAIDHRRVVVQNIAASDHADEYEEHRARLQQCARASTSSVHFFGENGRDYNAFARLYGLMPVALEASGRFKAVVPDEPDDPPEPLAVYTTSMERIPRIAHYVFGLRPEPEPFHLVHYLAVASCLAMVEPEEVHIHCHHLPFGPYWDLIEPRVVVDRVEPVQAVTEKQYVDRGVARYAYAHHADFLRLDVLAKHGGLYADLDTLFVAPLPGRMWRAPCVIGREADVPVRDGQPPRPALSNAILLSMPNSRFVEEWRAEIGDALDGSWANHSCFLAHDLAARSPSDVRVEPQRTFHAFEPTREGIALMLEHATPDLDGVVALHLMAHLWWDKERRDFSDVHAGLIDEEWIGTSESTYARASRPFLPPA
jgi:hypothetical protein